ncbi:hypothetical protein PI124_g5256 [Phytophthora idaei]|nr:hypothetical protein PI125_g21685 [Phytophthora idaei]KAG3131418.1 hypothetical protein PI126_g20068 [Phytophthora idaei]KAG3250136.1 hypothetical protein PI124_g5256 [Phytophthora idaei]
MDQLGLSERQQLLRTYCKKLEDSHMDTTNDQSFEPARESDAPDNDHIETNRMETAESSAEPTPTNTLASSTSSRPVFARDALDSASNRTYSVKHLQKRALDIQEKAMNMQERLMALMEKVMDKLN